MPNDFNILDGSEDTGTVAGQLQGNVAHDAADVGNPTAIGGYASAAAPTDVSADADRVRAWFLRNGSQTVTVTAAGALVSGDATNGLDVDVTRVIPGTAATALGKAEDAVHASGDTGVMILAVRRDTVTSLVGTDGDYAPVQVDAVGNLRCVLDSYSTLVGIQGSTAHDAVDAGNPTKLGGKVTVGVPTGVASADRVDAYFDPQGRLVTAGGAGFAIQHEPAANVQGTITRAAAGAGIKNVCTSVTAAMSATGVATAAQVFVRVRDGTTGAGTILWTCTLAVSATAGTTDKVSLGGLWIEGTANTAMTLEFSAAGGANTIQSVSLTGTTAG